MHFDVTSRNGKDINCKQLHNASVARQRISRTQKYILRWMQCFFPQNEVKQIQTPLFILNAAYDSWQVIIRGVP